MEEKTGTIDLYAAIEDMRRTSQAGGTFSMKFRKWNRDACRGGDIVAVNAARMRPKASDEKIANSSYKLYFTDTETGQARVCWQPLIIEYEGKRTVLT